MTETGIGFVGLGTMRKGMTKNLGRKKMIGETEEKVLIVDADKCTGCRVCELICSMAKHGEYNPQKSYIRVLKNREMDVNIVAVDPRCDSSCNLCVKGCLPGAIRFVTLGEAAILRKANRIGVFPVPILS